MKRSSRIYSRVSHFGIKVLTSVVTSRKDFCQPLHVVRPSFVQTDMSTAYMWLELGGGYCKQKVRLLKVTRVRTHAAVVGSVVNGACHDAGRARAHTMKRLHTSHILRISGLHQTYEKSSNCAARKCTPGAKNRLC